MAIGKRGSGEGEADRPQQHRRPRTRRGRLLASLQTRLDEASAELRDHQIAIAELGARLEKQRSDQIELARRQAAIEAKYESALDELHANRQRHQQHLGRLELSVEAQRHAADELDQILGAHDD